MKYMMFLSLVCYSIIGYAQSESDIKEKEIKVISEKSTDFYNAYEIQKLNEKSTTLFITATDDDRFETIKLDVGKCYRISYRNLYSVRVSSEKNLACKPVTMYIDNVKISDSGSLPRIILKKELIDTCD